MKIVLTALAASLFSVTASAPLANELGAKWIKNDMGRGYKIIQMFRTDCGVESKVEMKIVPQSGKAVCAAAGPVATARLDYDVDYQMHATTKDWKSDMNPATAMMFGNLKFDGPKMEAMSVMGPFKAFMTLASKVPGEAACPAK